MCPWKYLVNYYKYQCSFAQADHVKTGTHYWCPLPGFSKVSQFSHVEDYSKLLYRRLKTLSYRLQNVVIKSGTGAYRADNDNISDCIKTFSVQFLQEHDIDTPIDVLWNVFKEVCLKCLDMIPSKCYKPGTSSPWMNSTIKRLTHKKQRLYSLAQSSKCNDAWQKYWQIKKKVWHACCQARN